VAEELDNESQMLIEPMTAQTVLIVEDDPGVRTLLGVFVKSIGLGALFASSGYEALGQIPSASPDLMLLDVYMPKMDGIELLRSLCQKFPVGLPFGVILVTACVDVPLLHAALELGAFDVISKPVQIPELKTAVRIQLDLRTEALQAGRKTISARSRVAHSYKSRLIRSISHQRPDGEWIPEAQILTDRSNGIDITPVTGKVPYRDRLLADAAAVIIAKSWIDAQ
jgi:CheY-like chemotaxis protein